LLGARQEIAQVDLLGRLAFELRENHLERALEKLHLALDAKEISLLEPAELVLGGIPHAGADGPRAVAQLYLQIQVAILVGAKLLVRNQVHFVEGFAVYQKLHAAPACGREGGKHFTHADSWSYLDVSFLCMVQTPP
jgi:hypothetical protein